MKSAAAIGRIGRVVGVIAMLTLLFTLRLATVSNAAADALPRPFVRVEAGQKLPDYAFESLTKEGHTRERAFVELRGRPIVVVLWATWCGVCAGEMPKLTRLHETLGERIQVVPLSIDEGGIDYAARHLRRIGLGALPVYHDTQRIFFATMGAVGVPTTIVADAEGRIVARASGPVPWGDPAVRTFLSDVSPRPVAPAAPAITARTTSER